MRKLNQTQNFLVPHLLNLDLNPIAQVSLVDAAMPGMLPVINEFCVKQAIKTGLGS